ncbi:CopG family transcriptional regulator [Frankia sp. AgW1.1]|uniref:CopG family transcriptional regulator n=1 Tax=Frankia sp. AgW1.1 TaxID=1836971 RepID=UPI00193218B2|nr:CopG family transcriptional regulator [Frankia sp. AgW1.1]MBL7494377.1 CopG family transcriptional regulator [Frankia sp. AgW1.1]
MAEAIGETATVPDGVTRISVNLNAEAADFLRDYTGRTGVSYTEAIRRAIAVFKFVSDSTAVGTDVLVDDGRQLKKLVMVDD